MLIVIGGGPAGFFGAIAAREAEPELPVVLLERGSQFLRKVRISGGGRCNVTHACWDPRQLAGHYPRGRRELIGPFNHFGPRDTVTWFERRGVPLKTEPDGRIFPVSDDSGSIVDCLVEAARRSGVEIRTRCGVARLAAAEDGFRITLDDDSVLRADRVLLACGGRTGSPSAADPLTLATTLGHSIEPPVPSLFTFRSSDERLQGLAGVACAKVMVRAAADTLPRRAPEQTGPLLITHWGLSGPAILGLSSRCARELNQADYRFDLIVDWCPDLPRTELAGWFRERAGAHGRRGVGTDCPVDLPRRLWTALVAGAGIACEQRWAELGRRGADRLIEALKVCRFSVEGMSRFKDEFVTCGGVTLKEVDFRTMESRRQPGLHLAGEYLDIDGLTGGFNFQAAWTTGWLAGRAAAGLST